MWPYITKVAITALTVVAVAEVARRSTVWGALLASLPLTSILAFEWLYLDTKDTSAVAALAQSILWLVLPSLTLFVALPLMLRGHWGFWPALVLSSLLTAAAYLAVLWLIKRLGVEP
jgi:hypothetical protein